MDRLTSSSSRPSSVWLQLLLIMILGVTVMLVESKNTGKRRCRTSKPCKKIGGACQVQTSCNTFLMEGFGCPGTCGCCIKKAKKCKAKRDCITAGGFCVKSAKSCIDGEVISGACKCKKKKKKAVCCVPSKPTWSYDGEDGPDTWKDNWPTCGGDRQSPVNINTTEVQQELKFGFGDSSSSEEALPALEFTLYDRKPTKIVLHNDGNLLSMNWKYSAKPFVSGGGLDEAYLLDNLQFHWGSDNATGGSEHAVDNNKFALEVQLYHYKASYGSMKEALQKEDGVAALAVLFQVAEENNTALAAMLDQLDGQDLSPDNGQVELQYNQPLSAFLPQDTSSYYRYMGSLTHPACEEAAIWIIFASPLNVSDYQLDQLRRVRNSDNEPMQDNYRPLQPLGDREVFLPPSDEKEEKFVATFRL